MRDSTLQSVASEIARVEHSVDREVILDVLRSFKMKEPVLARVLLALKDDPGMLTRGDHSTTRFIESVLWTLCERGAVTVLRPTCPLCGATRRRNGYLNGQRVCEPCNALGRRERTLCMICGTISGRHSAFMGRDVCRNCWRHGKVTAHADLADLTNIRLSHYLTPDVDVTTASFQLKAGEAYRLKMELTLAPTDWFRSPADGTMAFARYYDALRQHGATMPARTCSRCGDEGLLVCVLDSRRVCQNCWRNAAKSQCGGCGKVKSIVLVTTSGSRLCSTCVNNLPENRGQCSNCGKERRLWDGPAGAQCRPCHRQAFVDTCRSCKRELSCRFSGTEDAICERCALRPRECATCGRKRMIYRRYPDGSGDCSSCVEPILEECTDCGRPRRVKGRLDGRPYCSLCVTKSPAYTSECLRCGTRDHLSRAALCKQCKADDLVEELFPERAADPFTEVLRTSLREAPPPLVFALIQRKRSVRILRHAIASGPDISHEFLNTLGTLTETLPVRSFLIDNGILQPRDEYLARLEQWVDAVADRVANPTERSAFLQFARWRHLRRLRQQGEATRPGQLSGPKTELGHVVQLLEWLHGRGGTLREIDQRAIDRWVAEGPRTRTRVKHFLRWAHTNKLAGRRIRIARPRGSDLIVVDAGRSEAEQALVRVLDPREDISGPDRLAAALLLLFGALPSRIVRLRLADIIEGPAGYAIHLGDTPVDLPRELDDAVRVTIATRSASRLLGTVSDHEWLFPGAVAGKPLSADAMTDRLSKGGVNVRAARRAALNALAFSLPPVVLANLTGVSVSTATNWAKAVSVSAARYAPSQLHGTEQSR